MKDTFNINLDLLEKQIQEFNIKCSSTSLKVREVADKYAIDDTVIVAGYALINKKYPLMIIGTQLSCNNDTLYFDCADLKSYTFDFTCITDCTIDGSYEMDHNIDNDFILIAIRDEESYDILAFNINDIYEDTIEAMEDLNTRNDLEYSKANKIPSLMTSNGNDVRCSPGYDWENDLVDAIIKNQSTAETEPEQKENKGLFII